MSDTDVDGDARAMQLHLRKIDAVIAQLNALNAKIVAETSRRLDAEIAQMGSAARKSDAEAGQIERQAAKTEAETRKLAAESFWYPLVLATTMLGGMAAVVGAVIALVRVLAAA